MKLKILGVLTLLLFTLMACQTTNDSGTGTDNPNVNPTNVRNQTGNGGMVNDRDYMMSRDSERNQHRNGSNRMNQGNNDSNYEVAEEAAEKITNEVDNNKNAYVLTTDNNAYVAAQLDTDNNNRGDNQGNMNRNNNRGNNQGNMNRNNNRGNNDLTDNVKEEIADIVRSIDKDIENVYVSTNPDFLNLANDYADDVDRGEPIEGFFDQIGTMIERIFPENNR